MTGLEYVLIGAVLFVLATSIVMVVRQRRAELIAERQAAHSLQRMAAALQGLQSELSRAYEKPQPATDLDVSPLRVAQDGPIPLQSELERAVRDHEILHVRLMLDRAGAADLAAQRVSLEWTRTAAQRMLAANHEAGSVVDLWEYVTRDAGDGPSYTDLMGSTFDDAVVHATQVGVMPNDQADVFREWAASTRAIKRTPRGGKRPLNEDVRDHPYIHAVEREAVG
ncbi:hypothetical protein [Microbacterium lacus]|uniref:Secreted protein n=1 Tax=Microbacterium lacus TaxID=415217 RepID=A0ABP4RWF0_9MICO